MHTTFGSLTEAKIILPTNKKMAIITHTAQNNKNISTHTGHTANQCMSAVPHDQGQQAHYMYVSPIRHKDRRKQHLLY